MVVVVRFDSQKSGAEVRVRVKGRVRMNSVNQAMGSSSSSSPSGLSRRNNLKFFESIVRKASADQSEKRWGICYEKQQMRRILWIPKLSPSFRLVIVATPLLPATAWNQMQTGV